ncbi:MAG: hypothetical protein WCO78_01670 [Candidatus Roizmanbacteria bacterium]
MSETQTEDNRNSEVLGGPKTEEGKRVSKYNATTHGILKFSLTTYESDILKVYLDQFMAEFAPVGALETLLTERATMYYVKLFRVAKSENEYMRAILEPRVVKYSNPLLAVSLEGDETVINEGYFAKITQEHVKELANTFQRYEVTLENRFYKTLHELERLQRARKGEIVSPPMSVEITNLGSSFGRNNNLTD